MLKRPRSRTPRAGETDTTVGSRAGPSGSPSSRNGQSMVEYTLIVTFLALFIIGVMTVLGPRVEEFLLARVDDETTGEAHHAVSEAVYE